MDILCHVPSRSHSFFIAFRRWNLLDSTACRTQCRQSHGLKASTSSKRHLSNPRSNLLAAERPSHRKQRSVDGITTSGVSIATAGREEYVRPGIARKQDARNTSQWQKPCRGHRYGSKRSYSSSSTIPSQPTVGSDQLIDSMRGALRTLTKPCVLVTTCTTPDDIQTFSGVTLSSFDAVTLSPTPHISFNIRVPSRTYDMFKASGKICVHILNATTSGATIADTFTKPYTLRHEPFELLQAGGASLHCDRASPAPQISLTDGVLSWLMCEKDGNTPELDVGDHKICTFVVKDIIKPTGIESDNAQALSYGQRSFRTLGSSIPPSQLGQASNLNTNAASQANDYSHSSADTQSMGNVLTTARSIVPPRGFGKIQTAAGFHKTARSLIAFSPSANADTYDDGTSETDKSTTTTMPLNTKDSQKEVSQPVNEETMQQTVKDFLCHSPTRRPGRMSRLRTARKDAQVASAKLEAAMADGTLTTKESEKLEQVITANERFIARALAYRAAMDLKDMLDEGAVSTSRIAYIEACIEKGQAALFEEAKDFASGRKRSGFSLVGLPNDRKAFEKADDILKTQLMRLRDLYEDDDHDSFLD